MCHMPYYVAFVRAEDEVIVIAREGSRQIRSSMEETSPVQVRTLKIKGYLDTRTCEW